MNCGPVGATIFSEATAEHLEVVRQLENQKKVLTRIERAMTETLRAKGKILSCGNGGSASDSQHLAAELVGRSRREPCGLPSIAPITDTSILTAMANDFGFHSVFSRQGPRSGGSCFGWPRALRLDRA